MNTRVIGTPARAASATGLRPAISSWPGLTRIEDLARARAIAASWASRASRLTLRL